MNKLRHKFFKLASVEIAAICNMTILVFCSFILTAKFKEIAPGYIPCWIHYIPTPITETILINNNKVTLEIPNEKIREVTLLNMINKYNISLLPYEQFVFTSSGIVNSPISGLRNYLDNYSYEQLNLSAIGIPTDSINSELYQWVLQSRIATKTLMNVALRISIHVNKNVQINTLHQVVAILEAQQIFKFKIIPDNNLQ